MTGLLTINASVPNIQMGGTNGNNIGLASSAGVFSTSASTGDIVLRGINNLILQSGSGAGAIIINSANNVGIGTTNPAYKLDVRGSLASQSLAIVDVTTYNYQYQLLLNSPTLTTGASIQTIQQGVNFTQNLTLQPLGGNVGIGTTNPLVSFHSYGVSYLQAKQGGAPSTGALGTDGTSLIIYPGSSGSQSMALGFASSQLWYNVPTGNYHNFYVAGTSVATITSTGVNATNLNTTGTLTSSGAIYANGNSLIFPNAISDFKISLWGTNNYGFGIKASTLAYFSQNYHNFYNSGVSTTSPVVSMDGSGNIINSGSISNGSSSYIYAGGLRLGGFDTGNTVYNGSKNMGLTVDSGYTVNLGMNGGNGTIIAISNGRIDVSQPIISTTYIASTTLAIPHPYGAWNIYCDTSYTSVIHSLIFQHATIGVNSFWWFNGVQTSTEAEISDERIKKNIQPINNALSIINQIQPKSFNLVDDKDVNFKYGFIAQEIEQIPALSDLVFTGTDYIANINSYGSHSNIANNQAIITSINIITDLVNVDDNIKLVFGNTSNQEFIIDDTPYKNRYKRRFANVVEVIDDYSFMIDQSLNIDETDPLFIYGKEVNDFKQLDYQSLFSLSIASIQELHKIVQSQQKQIDYLTSNILLIS